MPKVNTLFNYFSSPKGSNTPKSEKSTDVKSSPARSKSETPKRKQRDKVEVKKGKENRNVGEKKRALKSDEDEESSVKPKKRRIIIPSDNSDDSGEDFKPGSDDEMDESDSVSEGISESELGTESEEETPKKKGKVFATPKRTPRGTSKNVKAAVATDNPSQSSGSTAAKNPDTWPHLKYDFLQPDKIRDIEKRKTSDENYDPRTLFVPSDFLSQQTPAMRQWWEIKSRHFDCILFFKLGKFYELYHMDAVVGVNELNLTYMRGEFAHSGFPEIGFGRFSASLIERGYKIARIEQTENPEMMKQRVDKMHKPTKYDKVVKREVCQISTKGTRVYSALDVEASTPNSSYLLSLVEGQSSNDALSTFGVCFVDTTIGDFYLGQFQDDRSNSRLLTLLAHNPPVHVVYERGNLSQATMQILNSMLASSLKDPLQREVQFWSAATTLKKLHEGEYFKGEKDENFEWPEGLRPYLNKGDTLGLTPAEDKELAVHALGGCVYLLKDFLLEQQLLAQGRFKSYVPPDVYSENKSQQSKFPNCMVIDAVTIKNLNIFGEGSLIKALDHCCTAFGKRLLREWICRPSCRKAVIIERQKAVQELIDQHEIVQSARSSLANLPDLERLISKIHHQGNAKKMFNHPDGRAIMFEGHIYSKRKINDFISALNGFEQMIKIVDEFQGFESTLIKQCVRFDSKDIFEEMQKTLDYFKTAFDHEEAKSKGNIVPKKGVDSEYDVVLKEIAHINQDLNDYLTEQSRHFGVKIKFHGTDKKRFQIEVPDSQVKKVGHGYELQSQRKGFKRYYTAEAKELLARQINAEDTRTKVLNDLNRRIFAQFSDKYDMWSTAVYKFAVLDVLISFAEYAKGGEFCLPEIFDDTDEKEILIDIKEGRHPCIASDNFIPNDTVINTDDSASLLILTGPNMGGKSTLMRQVGLLTIMSQIGSYIPASSCRLTIADRIFTRLGANDDILAGQSTFLVELSETATILKHATLYSLVLSDELGRGTSTYDGTAIAAAVVDALAKIKCRTLFSTHYHSLVEDYKTNKDVTLAHMACMVETEEEDEVSQETVTFLYKLSKGACPKSYGFNAARLAGVPPIITKRAHEIANKVEQDSNQKHIFTSLFKADNGAAIRNILAGLN
ncbi:probable DNA mismatch repair protein Msh6 [Prorops nasuta]|uniref:probable DNA mismatch repair protein Msh6 n=1 Tax=Prorops nasuta TaxID=863751 RepID=UPI0034CD82A2